MKAQHLKMLPIEGLKMILRLMNLSFVATGEIPMELKSEVIRGLLKRGKEQSEVGSYRPV